MSIHLQAVKLIMVTKGATIIDHDGNDYPNYECLPGTVLAYDADNNLYVYDNPRGIHIDGVKSNWPAARNGRITLFRDHWTFMQAGAGTPFGDSFRNAEHIVLREVK